MPGDQSRHNARRHRRARNAAAGFRHREAEQYDQQQRRFDDERAKPNRPWQRDAVHDPGENPSPVERQPLLANSRGEHQREQSKARCRGVPVHEDEGETIA
jgi:hypothetical protein